MARYLIRRLLLMVPTLFGILLINFAVVQFSPGGPVEQLVFRLTNPGLAGGAAGRVSGAHDSGSVSSLSAASAQSRGARGLDPDMLKEIDKLYGFDRPPVERFWHMLGNYARLDFGTSFFRDRKVTELILDKMPVSISLGLWTTLLVYLISIPLGISKAVRDGSRFDLATSFVIVVAYAIPSFLFAILLIVLFAGGSYWQIFPLRGLTSDDFETMSAFGKAKDYLWHIALPVAALVLSGFASLTMLTKNSFLDEIRKQYVLTARAKGASETRILYGHIYRNAMLIVIAGLPGAVSKILFTGALLIEIIFSLDGMGLLAFESVVGRDYPVVFGTVFLFTLLGLVLNLLGDILTMLVDPRIDFERRGV